MALDSRYEAEAAKPPISLHPAFPAIVALWFAALLGVGSMVLPTVLLERVVEATGVASLIPAASPPLGFTARGFIAIAAAIIGTVLGLVIARRVAQSHRPEPETRVAKLAGNPRRLLNINDVLDGEGVTNGESLPISRRRALAISEDDRPSDFLYQAPLPGVDEDEPAPFAAAPFVEAAADEPLELCELAAVDVEPIAEHQPEDEPDEDYAMIDDGEFQSTWPSHQHYPPESEPADELDAELDKRKNLAGPRGLEPLPFSPPSLARRTPEPEPEPEFEPEPEVQLEAVEAVAPAAQEPEFHADWESAPLEGLGLVQLVQRLGSTIERRRERMEQGTPVSAPQFVAPAADFEAAPAEEAALAMAAFFSPNPPAEQTEPDHARADESDEAAPVEDKPMAMPRPNFLQPLATEDEDDEATLPDFTLPLRNSPSATVSFSLVDNDTEEGEPDTDEETDDAGADGYSSLLGMKNPFVAPKAEFVRIDEPEEHAELVEPTVVFPGQERSAQPAAPAPAFASRLFDPPGKVAAPAPSTGQAPADTDAALRAALATLQRMSGAA